ncbi:MAG: 2-C-methyl-D-erythritol 4-phosphate cytidylyltransferase [Burkholderiales bacterium]|nr:2-C-methyl-D-erythritol 4-phosphate cytidylyltransferase [Burkholderiales bacterium]
MLVAPRHFAIVPAAGIGARSGQNIPKQYVPLAGQPMLCHSLRSLAGAACIDLVVCVLTGGDPWPASPHAEALVREFGARLRFVDAGGPTRAASVTGGLASLGNEAGAEDWVLVHDAARPGLRSEDVVALVAALDEDPVGGILAVPVADTIKRADATGRIDATPSRDGLWLAQTPQMFRYGLLRQAYAKLPGATDEAAAVEALGFKPRLVLGRMENFKVTQSPDFALAETLLKARKLG